MKTKKKRQKILSKPCFDILTWISQVLFPIILFFILLIFSANSVRITNHIILKCQTFIIPIMKIALIFADYNNTWLY